MIVRPRPGILLLFFITRGSIVPKMAPQVLAITTLSVAVVGGARLYPGSFPAFILAPFSILGLALSIFLGFRNNACYDRWWEARRQWGQLIVETRSLARETLCLLGEADAEEDALRRRIVRRGIAFAAALAARLRHDAADLSAWLDPREAAEVKSKRNIPEAILRLQAADLARCRRTGRLSDILFQMLATRLAAMAGIQAACERIATTPLPFAYTLLVHRTGRTCSASCCRSGWWRPWAGRLRWSRRSPPTRSSVWMPWATSWRSRSAARRTACRWRRWCG